MKTKHKFLFYLSLCLTACFTGQAHADIIILDAAPQASVASASADIVTPQATGVSASADIITPQVTVAPPDPRLTTIQNEFIKISVNNGPIDQGRFSIETTNGNPENQNDNNKVLIFGKPVPWTSYTTIDIDGTPYIFGGKNKKIQKRSGLTYYYGEVASHGIKDNGIQTITRFKPSINVVQKLSFFRNPSTKVNDTALIEYIVTNEDSVTHDIGCRILLDTKLGENDAAPLRIGALAVETETQFKESDLQNFWQAFDDLASPNIVAQGVLRDEALGIYPPDEVTMANWGTLADHAWDVPFKKGRSFVREGETEQDTSLTMLWLPKTLAPGETISHKTLYGLGGLSLEAGELSLGLTAPAEVVSTSKQDILVVGYILNSGGFDSQNTAATLKVGKAFSIVEGSPTIDLGQINRGDTKQVAWKLRVKPGFSGEKSLTMVVTSGTLESNKTTRMIDVIPPPKLRANMATSFLSPSYVSLTYTLYNPSRHSVGPILVEALPSQSHNMGWFDIPKKTIPTISPNGKTTINWAFRTSSLESSNTGTPISVRASSDTILPLTTSTTVYSAEPKHSWAIDAPTPDTTEGGDFYVSFTPYFNVGSLTTPSTNVSLTYDNSLISFQRMSSTEAFGSTEFSDRHDGGTSIRNDQVSIHNDEASASKSTITLSHLPPSNKGKVWLTFHFKAIAAGDAFFDLAINKPSEEGTSAHSIEQTTYKRSIKKEN